MRFTFLYVSLFSIILISCKKEERLQQAIANQKEIQKRDSIFSVINKAWHFSIIDFKPKTQAIVNNWNQWLSFQDELSQKPTRTLSAFRQKTKDIVNKTRELDKNIPEIFDIPEIKSRLLALNSKAEMLSLYFDLDVIPEKKVEIVLFDMNEEIKSIQNKMERIVLRSHKYFEEGEEEMLKSLMESHKETRLH